MPSACAWLRSTCFSISARTPAQSCFSAASASGASAAADNEAATAKNKTKPTISHRGTEARRLKLVPKLCLGTQGGEAPLRRQGSGASARAAPKQSLGARLNSFIRHHSPLTYSPLTFLL